MSIREDKIRIAMEAFKAADSAIEELGKKDWGGNALEYICADYLANANPEILCHLYKKEAEFHKEWAARWKGVARRCRSRALFQEKEDLKDLVATEKKLKEYRELVSAISKVSVEIERGCRGCISHRSVVYRYRCKECKKRNRWTDYFDREKELEFERQARQ